MEYTTEFKVTQGFISLRIPFELQAGIDMLARSCTAGFMNVKLAKPRRPRTTGKYSQNSHAFGHCQQIANETGHELYEIEYIAKMRAIKRGYPVSTTLGVQVPKSQADIDTLECSYLIEEYHQIAAENNIKLIECEDDKKPKEWHWMNDAEKIESDPARFDEEKQLEIF